MSTNYIATVHKPTAVTDAVCGQFFHENHPNLILAKGNILEFHSVITDPKTQSVRLERDKDFQIFGEIAAMKLIKPLSRKTPCKPLLFFITEKHQVAFVEPASDNVPAECSTSCRQLDEENQEIRAGDQDPPPSRRAKSSKIDALLQKDYVAIDPKTTDTRRGFVRSRSCDNLVSRSEQLQCRQVSKHGKKMEPEKDKSSEFSHLRGPFWSGILSERREAHTAASDSTHFEPVVATPALRRRLFRLPRPLLERLFVLRPLLRTQIEEMSINEDICSESDVDMSGESSPPSPRCTDQAAMEVESSDDDHPMMETSSVSRTSLAANVRQGLQTDESNEVLIQSLLTKCLPPQEPEAEPAQDVPGDDELVFSVQRQYVQGHDSSGQVPIGDQITSHEEISVQGLSLATDASRGQEGDATRDSSLWPPLFPDVFSSNPKYRHPGIPTNEQNTREGLTKGISTVPVLPADYPTIPLPHLGGAQIEIPNARLTALLRRLMQLRHRLEVEEVLGEITAFLAAPTDHSDEEQATSPIERPPRRRSSSFNTDSYYCVDPTPSAATRSKAMTVSSIATCAETCEGFPGCLRTRASGKVRDRSGRPSDHGIICAISNDHAVIALNMIVGAVKFIAVKATLNNSEGSVEHFNARILPFRVLNMQFLNTSAEGANQQKRRALCILYEDAQGDSQLSIYDLSLREKYLRRNPRSSDDVVDSVNSVRRKRTPRSSTLTTEMNALASLVYDSTTTHIIPTVLGGAMFIGEKSITFYPRLMNDFGEGRTGREDGNLYHLQSDLAFQQFRLISCWASVSSTDSDFKYIMCEQSGHLLLAWLTPNKERKEDISKEQCTTEEVYRASQYESLSDMYALKIEYLGRVTNASVMVPLPYNHVFLGSKHGDSQLVRLEATSKGRVGTLRCPFRGFHVVSTFYNLAPIVDMCLVPTIRRRYVQESPKICADRKSASDCNELALRSTHQKTLVTCSNIGHQGTLRFLRNGLGLHRVFFCKAPKLYAAFSMGVFASNLALLSYPDRSRLANLNWLEEPESAEEVHPPRRIFAPVMLEQHKFDLDFSARTIAVHHNEDMLSQVTTREVRLFTRRPYGISRCVDCWAPATSANISSAAVNIDAGLMVVACGGNRVYRLDILANISWECRPKISTVCDKVFENDSISCVAMGGGGYVACGLWLSGAVHILTLERLETVLVLNKACGDYAIPRSVCLERLNNSTHLVVGDSIGNLSYTDFNLLMASVEKAKWNKVKLGSEPIFTQMLQISSLTERNEKEPSRVLFVGGENPVVMLSPKPGKITMANVNAQNVMSVHSWYHPAGDYLLMVSRNYGQNPHIGCDKTQWTDCVELSVCRVEGLNDVQVKTLNIYETPRRIVYHQSSDCLGVLVYHVIPSQTRGLDASAISLQSDLRQCASYRAPTSVQLFDKQAGKPFANLKESTVSDVMRPATKRKSKDDGGPLLEEARKGGTRHEASSSATSDPSDNDSAQNPSRWDPLTVDSTRLQRWVDQEEHAILLVDRSDLRFIASYFLRPEEQGCSITTCSFKYDGPDSESWTPEYLVVGTGTVKNGEIEPTSGRILIFEVDPRTRGSPMLLVSETEVDGAVYSMSELEGFLVATINCRVKLFGMAKLPCLPVPDRPAGPLVLFETIATNSLALYVKCRKNRCLVGDLLRSLELFELQWKPEVIDVDGLQSSTTTTANGYKLISVARDHNPNWVTAIEILSPDVFVATENFCNLFVCTSRGHQQTPSDGLVIDEAAERGEVVKEHIREVSLLHLGEFVNVIRCGSLVSQVTAGYVDGGSSSTANLVDALAGFGLFDEGKNVNTVGQVRGSFMLGSAGGWIGQMMCISRRLYIFLWEIQKRLQTRLQTIGRIDHGEWRAFESEMKVEASSGFIDGSLLESLVDMNAGRVLEILRGIRIENTEVSTVNHLEPLFRLLEDMSRLH